MEAKEVFSLSFNELIEKRREEQTHTYPKIDEAVLQKSLPPGLVLVNQKHGRI